MKKLCRFVFLIQVILFMGGCSFIEEKDGIHFSDSEETSETGFVREEAGFYDSADTAVITSVSLDEQKIIFHNFQLGRNYTLKYDGATVISDKYGTGMAMSQVEPGSVVDITFYKLAKRLNSMNLSDQAWSFSNVKKFDVLSNQRKFFIGEEEYALHKNAVVLSEARQGELSDLNRNDILTVRGIDHEILSITVEKGHGYLRLTNEEYFVGGWIEVGQELIQPITDDMLLIVPEGTYQVLLTNTGIETTREITIERNGEIELDVGDVVPAEKKFGQILFSISPADASLYLDGELTDGSKPVSLEYGIHQMIAKAEGYDTLSQYIKVGQDYANINIEMEASKEEQDEELDESAAVSANTVTSNNTVLSSTDQSSKIFIEAPEGAEVYLDTNYVGITPVSFEKTAGTHVITLRKSGYVTKSYTIQVDSTQKDIIYSFSNLVSE